MKKSKVAYNIVRCSDCRFADLVTFPNGDPTIAVCSVRYDGIRHLRQVSNTKRVCKQFKTK